MVTSIDCFLFLIFSSRPKTSICMPYISWVLLSTFYCYQPSHLTTYNINVHKQATTRRLTTQASLASLDGLLTFLKKKRAANSEYLLDIIKEIEAIEVEWQRMVNGLEDEVAKARRMNIAVDDDEAYLRCCHLLQEEFQAEEDKFAKLRRKLKISIQSLEEHIDVCQGEKA